ncbi:MAG: hypothetical protein WDN28_14620 [Chthoniobacter sp.]
MMRLPRARDRRAFMLLEAMIAVMIFGMAALGLARCVQNCLRAEKYRREEALAQRALANYFTQIELGAFPLSTDAVTEEMQGAWLGMTMVVTREALPLMNEKDQEIFGVYQIGLRLSWGSKEAPQLRTMDFILYPRNTAGTQVITQ